MYKISDVINGEAPVNITGSCEGFGTKTRYIDLALAPSDESYLYAMASDANGLMRGLYLTRNTNSWLLLSTSTVTPFTSAATARTSGALAVSPIDPAEVYIAGANLWKGKGYVENSPYQWTVLSSNEIELNFGDYMSYVYSNAAFLHSGVQEITPFVVWDEDANRMNETFVIATDGGVYTTNSQRAGFVNYNRGLNNVQINGIAVSPDGSIISGANSNACPFIEGRVTHNGGVNDSTWYDNSRTNMNHMANIIWKGDGGKVAGKLLDEHVHREIVKSGENELQPSVIASAQKVKEIAVLTNETRGRRGIDGELEGDITPASFLCQLGGIAFPVLLTDIHSHVLLIGRLIIRWYGVENVLNAFIHQRT